MFVLALTETNEGLDETAPFYLLIISAKSAGRMTPVSSRHNQMHFLVFLAKFALHFAFYERGL